MLGGGLPRRTDFWIVEQLPPLSSTLRAKRQGRVARVSARERPPWRSSLAICPAQPDIQALKNRRTVSARSWRRSARHALVSPTLAAAARRRDASHTAGAARRAPA